MAQFSAAPGSPAIPTYADAPSDPLIPAGYSERLYNEKSGGRCGHQTWGRL
jgi:hypothetical protein